MTAFPECPRCGTIGKTRSKPGVASCSDPECPVMTWDIDLASRTVVL